MVTKSTKKGEGKQKAATKVKPVPEKIEVVKSVTPVIETPPVIPAPEGGNKPVRSVNRGALMLGGTLLIVGVIWFVGQLLNISFGQYTWPFIFIVPGIMVFISAMNMEFGSGDALSILSGILTMLGLMFLVMTITGFWASWAYAWSLLAPTSIGISQLVFGTVKKRAALVNSGTQLIKVGLTIFAVGFIFFELIIGLNGFNLERFGLPTIPIVLIGLGVIILVHTLFLRKK